MIARLPLCLLVVLLISASRAIAQNDKQVIGDAVFTPFEIAEGATAMFLVRFQNVWSDTVYQIVVRDTLDPRFEITSFSMVAASHQYELLQDGSNVIRWYFTNITLPDSTSDYGASVGFILYTVKPKPFLTPGQTIGNQACVTMGEYPEYCTENAYIWIDGDADVDDPESMARFQVVPNPNYGQFEIRQSESSPSTSNIPEMEWWITDINGKTIFDGDAANADAAGNQVWLEKPAPGLYLLWMKCKKQLKVEQFAVIR